MDQGDVGTLLALEASVAAVIDARKAVLFVA